MPIERITTKTLHLERTSEADKVPARWAIAEQQRQFDLLTKEQQDGAVFCGWTGNRIEYQHRLTDVEYERAGKEQLAALIQQFMADGVLTADEATALVQAAAAAVAP